MRRLVPLSLVLGLTAIAALSCGGDDSSNGGVDPGCTRDPNACPAGQTCWPIDAAGRYGCIDAPADKTAGAACSINPNQATCAPGHFCFPVPKTANGTCSPFCTNGACANGAVCFGIYQEQVEKAPTIYVCQPTGTGGSGGTGGTGGATGGAAGAATGGVAGADTGGAAGAATGGASTDGG